MTVQAVVFDLDDTLYLERQFVLSGFRVVTEEFAEVLGDPATTFARCCELFESPHRRRVFDRLVMERVGRADPALVARMIECYRGHRPTISLEPDAQRALTRLRETHRLGLITDGISVTQWNKIDALELRGRLDEIIVTSDLTEEDARLGGVLVGPPVGLIDSAGLTTQFGKPHPLAFLLISRRLDIPDPQCAYVADNPGKDFAAPNSLGWRTIMVRRNGGVYLDAEPTAQGNPAHTIATLDALDPLLD